jgi:type I restriction enzyme M protein
MSRGRTGMANRWRGQRAEAVRLDAAIAANLKELGYGG